MSVNAIAGSVPTNLAVLSQLGAGVVNFASNQLYGSVPAVLTATFPVNGTAWSGNCIVGASSRPDGCDMVDRPTLVSLFTATSQTGPWVVRDGWLTSAHPCTWAGVACAADNASVTGLALDGYGLGGGVDVVLSTLTAVAGMQSLSAAQNQLSGTLPDVISALSKLT